MQELNFPKYSFRFKSSENKLAIFDEVRKKFILLTPEEWVRQHTVRYLLSEKKYPNSLTNVEKVIKVNDLTKRYDVVVYNPDGSIFLLVECKAPNVKITQETFNQIARYNLVLKAEHLMVTNGLNHYYCKMDFENERYIFLEDLPPFVMTKTIINQPKSSNMEIQHTNGEIKGVFKAIEGEKEAGKMTYSWAGPQKFIINHTEVSSEFGGQGVGKKMVMAAVEFARQNDLKIVPLCPFAKGVFQKTEDIRDVLG